MKEIFALMMALLLVTMLCGSVLADQGTESNPGEEFSDGSAPNSGDGVPDGSGMGSPFQNGDPSTESPGPAPNSGDGIPDGSGF